uniref:response regulator n=1 Tax=Sediminibacterium sp. TaxID=1917865 RepID=UPI003F6A5205
GLGVIEKIRETKPDIVLLDLNLPERHGKEILQEIKKDAGLQHIPVIIISADAMPNQISELKALGAAGYLTKPIEIKSFIDIIDTYIK